MRTALLSVLVLAGAAGQVTAQDGLFLTGGEVLAGPNESAWRLTLEHDLRGPFSVDWSAVESPGSRPGAGNLYGAGADLTLFSAAHGLPTLFVGAEGGIGLRDQGPVWVGWSAGARVPVVAVGTTRVLAEARWRNLTVAGRRGFEVGVMIGFRAIRRDATNVRPESVGLGARPPVADLLKASGIPDAKAQVLEAVVETALDEMGQPYVWGGTGDGNGGFDCSGLIQFAYSRSGIPLPRTAQGQSTSGIARHKDLDDLLPGDILTFSERGDVTTHVGLYVGDGQFIHSASTGVRLSHLSEDDPYGRTWFRKWTGVRRIVE
ncbi:MAG TPA: C40 family peptidase [Gemmatimonadales bacterium]|jgi:hypothetical protein|nr:C40 family peptidase [Gemmatimonadales bacterium]